MAGNCHDAQTEKISSSLMIGKIQTLPNCLTGASTAVFKRSHNHKLQPLLHLLQCLCRPEHNARQYGSAAFIAFVKWIVNCSSCTDTYLRTAMRRSPCLKVCGSCAPLQTGLSFTRMWGMPLIPEAFAARARERISSTPCPDIKYA